MIAVKSKIAPAPVRRAHKQFERRRAGKQRRERIPERLRRIAVKLCKNYAISQAAKRLRLNQVTLFSPHPPFSFIV